MKDWNMKIVTHRIPALVLVGVIAVAAVAATLPRSADAANVIIKNNDVHKNWDLAILAHALWWGGAGVGLRLGIPIAPKGFIPAVNDQVKIELGFSYQHWWMYGRCDPRWDWCDRGVHFHRFAFPVLFRWDFFILPILTTYFTIGVEFGFIPDREVWDDRVYYYGLAVFAGSLGILVNFHERVSLRAEFSHSSFNLGIEFKL